MIKFFSKIRFLLTYILPPMTTDLSDGTWNARKGLPDYEKIYLRNNVRTKMNGTNHFALFLSTPQIHLSSIWCHP